MHDRLLVAGTVQARPITREVLRLDAASAVRTVAEAIRDQVLRQLRRRGVVVGLSGGIDSSVTAALCVEALGRERVFGVLMPERDSDPDSLTLGRHVADTLGIASVVEDIAPMLEAAGCYRRRDAFIQKAVPHYGPGWRCKVVLPGLSSGAAYNVSYLVVQSPSGTSHRVRLSPEVYLGIVAATNMKQRTRKQIEYYHADRLNYAVAGTPNRLEYDQGFFVKNGDGMADLKPIAHLYKTQVYQLAEWLGLPEDIRTRPPTTDTWSLAQTQEEFYFALPHELMDLCLYGLNHGFPAAALSGATGLTPDRIEAVYRDIRAKRRATRYLHAAPLLVENVAEVG